MPSLTYIFIDTNTALHFQRPDQIDWLALAGSDTVVLVGTPILLRELEQQKVHNKSRKLRERAGAYIKWLANFVRNRQLPVRPGVTWHFISTEPMVDFPANNLSDTIADDHLIASVLSFSPSPPGAVCVATGDLGLELKLTSRGITPQILAEELRLPPEPDPVERELQELKRQAAQKRAPRLSAYFPEGQEQRLYMAIQEPELPDVPTIADIRREYPLYAVPPQQPEITGTGKATNDLAHLMDQFQRSFTPPRERVTAYNEAVEKYYVTYQDYLNRLQAWAATEALKVRVDITAFNSGTMPATDYDLVLTFPDDILLHDEDEGTDPPEPPDPPEKPTIFGLPPLTSGIARVRPVNLDFGRIHDYGLGRLHDIASKDFSGSPSIDAERNRVTFGGNTLKHGFERRFEPFYLRFPSRDAVRSFQVTCELSAAELPEPFTETLHFIVGAAPEDPSAET